LRKKATVTATPEHQVLERAASLVAAFGRHDATAYFEHFASDASFIFYTHHDVLTSRSQWEGLWARWESEDGFRVHSCQSHDGVVQMVGSDVAVFHHTVESRIEMDGQIDTVWERETIVFHLIDGQWTAVHEHLSPREDS
jgi:ketosteroid isomerase-like protein